MSDMRDPTDLLEQGADAEAEQAQALAVQAQQAEDLKWLMKSEAGRRIAWRVLARTGLHRTPFTGHDAQTNFNCGQADVGLWFQAEILDHAPDAYLRMLKEHAKA